MKENVGKLQVSENTQNIVLDNAPTHGDILSFVIRLPRLKCLRCGYTWFPRAEKKPQVCANRECKSPYWDRPRQQKKVKVA